MNTVQRPRVFGAGLIALDLVVSMDPKSPVRSWAGGTCGNVLSILAYLGWDAFPIARLNGDPASERVRADMAGWGVHLDFANCPPTTHSPMIIQQIGRGRDGLPTHRFSWACPRCGQWFPGFKPVTVAAVELVAPRLPGSSVFFFDRLSRATLTLAAKAAKEGALVVFEPSGRSDERLLSEALRIAHVVKYANERLATLGESMHGDSANLVEVQTLGAGGLRFRHRLDGLVSNWEHLEAISAPVLTDTCGSGDWCTAGLIAKVADEGQEGFRRAGAKGLREALRYGQTLAAWNCGFEGARGGMYAVSHDQFDRQIGALGTGPGAARAVTRIERGAEVVVSCPACPPCGPEDSGNTNSRRAA